MSEWLAYVEVHNVPHFMRGCVFSLALWIIGLKWIQSKTGIGAATFSLVTMFVFSVGWETRDVLRGPLSDGFSILDIIFDMLGWGFVQLVHLATHKYDK